MGELRPVPSREKRAIVSGEAGRDRLFLRQGQIVRLTPYEKIRLFTPLGSCVSCIIFHPNVGAVVTHAKFPHQEYLTNTPAEAVESSTRSAIEHFEQSDIPRKHWVVMLFGGGVMHHLTEKDFQYSLLGWLNVICALEILLKKKLMIARADFGGFGGRRLHFWTETGQTVCQRLKDSYGGISVSSTTPTWLLLDSMRKRFDKIRDRVQCKESDDEFEEFSTWPRSSL